MKKMICLILCTVMLGMTTAAVTSASERPTVISDGKVYSFQGEKPYVDSRGILFLPLSDFCKGNGLGVEWVPSTKTVIVTNGGQTIMLKDGNNRAMAGKTAVQLDAPVTFKNGVAFVSADFFSKCAGFEMNWDKKANRLDVATPMGLLKGIACMKQSTIRVQRNQTVYFDPFMIEGEQKIADVVFVTHTHGDHFSVADIKKVLKDDGTLVITADGVDAAKTAGIQNILTVVPNKSYSVKGINFSTVPSYNTNKDFHKAEYNWVGYIADFNGAKYYVAGDTDVIKEMKSIKADVAFLPVGGTYTMTAAEAADAANLMKPSIAVPIHFGDIVGTTADAAAFINLLNPDIKGVMLKDLLSGIKHFKQSTIRIQRDKTIYIDPFLVDGEPKDADIVLVTHPHGDHFSIADIKKVLKDDGILAVTPDCKDAAAAEGFKNIVTVEPNKSYDINGIKVETVPAYNTNKDFHKKASGWVGYILNLNGSRYYMAGDTDVIGEMNSIKADVAFLPVGGTYTMTGEEAARAANAIMPSVAVPIHFIDVVGTLADAQMFTLGLDGRIKGVILK